MTFLYDIESLLYIEQQIISYVRAIKKMTRTTFKENFRMWYLQSVCTISKAVGNNVYKLLSLRKANF